MNLNSGITRAFLPGPVTVYFFLALLWSFGVVAQSSQAGQVGDDHALAFDASLNNYFFRDDYIFNPILSADREGLHLEGRYNYEDINTLSLFAGYNIQVGHALLWEATPMFGFAFGQTNGVIPALESTLSYGAFEWYFESEYVLITDEGDENYFYTWFELNYYPFDWLSVGVIGTRTRLYETGLEVQYGLSLGYHHDSFSVIASSMNFGEGDPYFYLSAAVAFE